MRTRTFLFAAALAALHLCGPAAAQTDWVPTRPIKLVVPYGPGASTDTLARLVAQKVSEDLKQPVVIDNRAGAGGMIGSAFVAKQPPDGYTILLGTDGTHAGNPHLIKDHPFDAIKDVTPITLAARGVLVLVAHPSAPVNSIPELIKYAEEHPGKLSYGSSGNGSPHHLAGALLEQLTGISMTHVPYKGGGVALNDVVGGQIPLVFATLVTAQPFIQSGKLKALAVTEKTRFKAAPNVPAVAETVPGYEMSAWLAFFGPPNMPEPVLRTLHASITKALRAPDVHQKLEDSGLLVVGNSPQQFATMLKADYEARGQLIRRNNIHAQ